MYRQHMDWSEIKNKYDDHTTHQILSLQDSYNLVPYPISQASAPIFAWLLTVLNGNSSHAQG